MSLIPYAPFNVKQCEYIKKSQSSWLNVAEGGKRAGKNITNLVAWATTLETHKDRLHLAAGVSLSAVKMNIIDSDGFGLEWIFKGRCRHGEYNGRDALFIRTKMGEKVVLMAGGADAGTAKLIKGHSYGTAYITEVNEVHQTFMNEVIDRTLASSDRKIFFDLNPKPPAHWFYADFLNYQDKLKAEGRNPRYNYCHFTIYDNMSISDATLSEELAKYDPSSIWYLRDILGRRTVASGRIYTAYRYDDVRITAEALRQKKFVELSVGVDVGGTDATCATLVGLTRGYEEVCVIDGLYHKQGIETKMTEAVYSNMVADWLMPWVKVYPTIGTVYVDSAAKLFRTALDNEIRSRQMGGHFIVRGFDKSDGINERISLNQMLLVQGRYKVASHLKAWHEAYQMAAWDSEEFSKGEWVRIDDGSYPVDALDSSEYAFYPLKRFIA